MSSISSLFLEDWFTENVILEVINVFIVFIRILIIFTSMHGFHFLLVVFVFFSISKGWICIWFGLVAGWPWAGPHPCTADSHSLNNLFFHPYICETMWLSIVSRGDFNPNPLERNCSYPQQYWWSSMKPGIMYVNVATSRRKQIFFLFLYHDFIWKSTIQHLLETHQANTITQRNAHFNTLQILKLFPNAKFSQKSELYSKNLSATKYDFWQGGGGGSHLLIVSDNGGRHSEAASGHHFRKQIFFLK